MIKKYISILIVCSFFLSYQARPQMGITVVDKQTKHALAKATIHVENINDTSISFSTITNDKGFFSLALTNGNYTININYTGYEKFSDTLVILNTINKTLPDTIALTQSAKKLQEVTVSTRKPFIEMRSDKITLNVAESPIAAGGNAYDVILKAPGVSEQNNTLSFRGKSINIIINGRPSNLSGEDLKTMLTNMPATNIEKIEILPMPSSKYDAQGGVVIDIKLAKNKAYGINGIYLAGMGAGRFFWGNTGLNLNYRNRNINIYGSYNYQHNQQYYNTATNRFLSVDENILANEYDVRSRNNHAYKIGADYDINKNNSIGFLFNGYTNFRDRVATNNTTLSHESLQDSFVTVNTKGYARFFNPSLNLYYKTTLDTTGKELTINADYFNYNKKWNDNFINNYFTEDKQPYLQPYLLQDNSPADITIKSVTADFVYPIKNGTIAAGLKSAFTVTDNDLLWQYQREGDWLIDTTKTNHFLYKENINAAYINYDKAFKSKYELSAGVRAEQTNTQGNSLTLETITKQGYINFFPNLTFSYIKNENNSFSIGYRKSIERFGFDIVNPFVIYQSQYSYSKGNPNIKPQIDHNFNFTYTYKQALNFAIDCTHSLKALAPVYFNGANNVVISSYDNLSSGDILFFSASLQKNIKNIWSINLLNEVGFMKYNQSSAGGNRREPNVVNAEHSLFPAHIDKVENGPFYNNRLAWCYGDLNHTLLLYRAGKLFKNASYTIAAEKIGKQTIYRKTYEETLSSDTQFCHGSAGLAQFYKVLYYETGNDIYLNSYNYWIDVTVNMVEQDMKPNENINHTGLLEGLAGTALVLTDYFSTGKPGWSKVFLL